MEGDGHLGQGVRAAAYACDDAYAHRAVRTARRLETPRLAVAASAAAGLA
jgi:hypothetical protein